MNFRTYVRSHIRGMVHLAPHPTKHFTVLGFFKTLLNVSYITSNSKTGFLVRLAL